MIWEAVLPYGCFPNVSAFLLCLNADSAARIHILPKNADFSCKNEYKNDKNNNNKRGNDNRAER